MLTWMFCSAVFHIQLLDLGPQDLYSQRVLETSSSSSLLLNLSGPADRPHEKLILAFVNEISWRFSICFARHVTGR